MPGDQSSGRAGRNAVRRPRMAIALLAAIVGAIPAFISGCTPAPPALVVYCAHDSIYAEEVLRKFERRTGIPVAIKFDTEATKSLGLVNLLIAERDHPRCDVFWNNEVLGTMDLQEQDVLTPYRGSGFRRIPPAFKDPAGHWTGFGARLRVFIVNTDKMPASPAAITERMESPDLSRVAIAKPLYGTTLTHYSLLWHLWGRDKLQKWHRDVRRRGLIEASGNAQVKNLVAAGTCDLGWTDTDDYFIAQDAGRHVAMAPLRVGEATILIPNSVAIVKGGRQLEAARKLVDFLLSEETELALAASKARQIPLGPVDEQRLSADIKELREWSRDGYALNELRASRKECLAWLKSEYLK